MRFAAGLLAGLVLSVPSGLLAQPPVQPVQVEPVVVVGTPAFVLPEPRHAEWGDLTDAEVRCLIRWMERTVGKGWDVVTVITFLERSWADFDGPCDAEVNG